jgi:outer membrane protein OmpA-like peptidoglycan-associated protein
MKMSQHEAVAAPKQSTAQASGILQRKCDGCKKKRAKGLLQRTAVRNDPVMDVPPIVHEVLCSPGQPLDRETRAFMEPHFGHDFSRVRVHTDARAAESAKAVNALAYTVGRDVVFGAGQYSPDTDKGKKLVAHELTHVLQQGEMNNPAIGKKLEIKDPEDENERQADRFTDRVVSNKGGILGNIAQAQLSLQRACGRSEIGIVSDCLGQSGDVVGEVFHFRINCDTFSPARDESRLRAFAATLQPDDIIEIHGFASIDGPADFNENLSCARAHKAESVLIEEGVSPAQIRPLIMHGATQGNATERRSAVIDKQPATPAMPRWHACFDGSTIYVSKGGQSHSCSALTGNIGAPTPSGTFCIRRQGEAQRRGGLRGIFQDRSRWYLIEPQFPTTRFKMQLHFGTFSSGCITVTDQACFERLASILNSPGTFRGFGYDGYPPGNSEGVNNPRRSVDCVGWLEVTSAGGCTP